ncbi:DUF1381 domain-containing protein [Staphylococcus sp. GDX8P107P-1]|uniref:DUF1381 domain-containing protein n=1 Tax=Staphylococcus sp. GDX8P107P-1 TaxID=2804109 RepID=UPI001AEC4B53|nr:DUF1381 domain-containing protein [Staphylococcus sp. GDX8P107P-1]
MTQYLIRSLIDSTGHPFTHVTKARKNETYQVVEAESKEEALEWFEFRKNLFNKTLTPNEAIEENVQWLNRRLMERSILSKRQRKKWYKKHYGKDSE